MKGRRGEGEDINGHVVEAQRRLGGRAPVNEVLVSVSRRIESGALQRGPENAKLLVDAVRRVTELEIP